MMPEIIEFRDCLPSTSSGKIDRKKLGDEMTSRFKAEE
jgi:acyl-CoA synthetase (AMP-forming)/AMP-acid ligase II